MSKADLRTVLVDDEELARKRLRTLLEELDEYKVSVCAEAKNGKEALKVIPEHQPDLIFLDIQMPVLDGFDVAEILPDPRPPIIFATAYDEYALRAFEVHAVDYLLKPIRKERLARAVERALQHNNTDKNRVDELLKSHQPPQDRIGVHHKQEILLMDTKDILWFEADGKLVYAITEKHKYRVDFNLDQLTERLDNQFIRCHRSLVVNTGHINKLLPWFNHSWRLEMKNGAQLDVARRRVTEIKNRLGIL